LADSKSELAEIKRFGGTPQKNSGRGAVAKGDATLGPFLIDVKEYEKGYTISLDTWAKICTDAVQSGRMQPALNIVLGKDNRVRVWAVGEKMFLEMLEAWEEKYNG
jgi:hypothetical protein